MAELIDSPTAERLGIDNHPSADLIPKLRRLCTEVLEPVRQHYGQAFKPNSGYRSLELNNTNPIIFLVCYLLY
ncbi:D-Ala-D-Ala carboxypeptidase family metallohydrolase [Alginatibacterium sediminis]|uniref:D-Ala-D-Ala carboxypeptidase family metallohydrolase n=1 Tax=Alginatibacterium sediminis TaxID=2164068 RepID=UPI00131464F2|nr:D-Ala-D-Ala carboxypeptidase family metallohydrolase [Alginatibacterium sediminis]